MDYSGVRCDSRRYVYQAPLDDEQIRVCVDCALKSKCTPHSIHGRVVAIDFANLPHIDPNDPPMAKRFKAMMKRRPGAERMIERLKCDSGDETLAKRGNRSFQAYLDKTLLVYHILLRN